MGRHQISMSEINVANEYLDKGMSPKNTEIEKFISKIYHNAKTKEELSLVDKINEMRKNNFIDMSWEIDHSFKTQLKIKGTHKNLFYIIKDVEDLDLHIHELKQIAALFEKQ